MIVATDPNVINALKILSDRITVLEETKSKLEDGVKAVLDTLPCSTLEEIQAAKNATRVLTCCATKVLFFKKLLTIEAELLKSQEIGDCSNSAGEK